MSAVDVANPRRPGPDGIGDGKTPPPGPWNDLQEASLDARRGHPPPRSSVRL